MLSFLVIMVSTIIAGIFWLIVFHWVKAIRRGYIVTGSTAFAVLWFTGWVFVLTVNLPMLLTEHASDLGLVFGLLAGLILGPLIILRITTILSSVPFIGYIIELIGRLFIKMLTIGLSDKELVEHHLIKKSIMGKYASKAAEEWKREVTKN